MTPRPFYRWKSFWLGLIVACFLGAFRFTAFISRIVTPRAYNLTSRRA